MGGLDGFDGFFDDFFDEEEFDKYAKLVESRTVEKNGETYIEEVWQYGDTTVTKTYIHANFDEEESSEEDIEHYHQNLVDKIRDLKEDIQEAVKKENYEKAADLKERITELEKLINKNK